ncbi:MAG: hypothetical protein ACLTMP_00900 [Eggerthella lenta]
MVLVLSPWNCVQLALVPMVDAIAATAWLSPRARRSTRASSCSISCQTCSRPSSSAASGSGAMNDGCWRCATDILHRQPERRCAIMEAAAKHLTPVVLGWAARVPASWTKRRT